MICKPSEHVKDQYKDNRYKKLKGYLLNNDLLTNDIIIKKRHFFGTFYSLYNYIYFTK